MVDLSDVPYRNESDGYLTATDCESDNTDLHQNESFVPASCMCYMCM